MKRFNIYNGAVELDDYELDCTQEQFDWCHRCQYCRVSLSSIEDEPDMAYVDLYCYKYHSIIDVSTSWVLEKCKEAENEETDD